MRERRTRPAVATRNVAQTPVDLSDGVGLPIRPSRGHLASRESLRNTVGTGGGILRVGIPMRFAVPQGNEALELGISPASGSNQRFGEAPRVFTRIGQRNIGRDHSLCHFSRVTTSSGNFSCT